MTSPQPAVVTTHQRTTTPKTVLMCPPAHFEVAYAINPWMDPSRPTDRVLAMEQWLTLRDAYIALGFTVHEIVPVEGLPDMVYAANGALVVDGVVTAARFRFPERAPEADAYANHLAAAGWPVVPAAEVNEGEGDFLLVGDAILAGTGFRTSPASHAEIAVTYAREVVPLTLIRPEYYHLDTALAVLDDRPGSEEIAYLPSAFAPESLAELRRRFPTALEVSEADAAVLGLNVVSDGRHVVLPVQARAFAAALAERGFVPIPVDLSELLKGGGGVKCCTLELRS